MINFCYCQGAIEREESSIERVKGLGLAPAKIHEHVVHESSIEKEIRRLRDSESGDGKTKHLTAKSRENEGNSIQSSVNYLSQEYTNHTLHCIQGVKEDKEVEKNEKEHKHSHKKDKSNDHNKKNKKEKSKKEKKKEKKDRK